MPDVLAGVPAVLLIAAGLIGGMCVIVLHGWAGLLATRTIKYRASGRAVGLVLVLAGVLVGSVLAYALTMVAIEGDVGVTISRCVP